ncbi:hypothetical protein EBR21_10530 [bacterium]|nr:hypothetical protein [bacterium]
MKTWQSWPVVAFVVSVVLHGIPLAIAKRMPSTIPQTQSVHLQRVAVRLLEKANPPRPVDMLRKNSKIDSNSQLRRQHRSQEDPLNPMSRDADSQLSIGHSRDEISKAETHISADSVTTQQEEPATGASRKSGALAASESVLQQLAEPCRSITLPSQWTRLKQFWPRRYNAEFRVLRDPAGGKFDLTRMTPEGPASPALDERIFKSFSVCLQEQADKLNSAVLRYSGALTPEPGEAYSVLMEFSPGDTRVASQQGI